MCLALAVSASANDTLAPVPGLEEALPPVARDELFGTAQIRYCLAQIIRIEAIRPLLDRTQSEQVAYFNDTVADYNARCGRYRYEGDALAQAKEDVAAVSAQIEHGAQAALRQRFPPPVPVVASEPPSGPPPVQAAPESPSAPPPVQAASEPPSAPPSAQAAPEREVSERAPVMATQAPSGVERVQPANEPLGPPAPPRDAVAPAPVVPAVEREQPKPAPAATAVPSPEPVASAPSVAAPPTPPAAAQQPPASHAEPGPAAKSEPLATAKLEPATVAQPKATPAAGPAPAPETKRERAGKEKPARTPKGKPDADARANVEPAPRPAPAPAAPEAVAAAAHDPAEAGMSPLERYSRAIRRDRSLVVAEQDYPPAAQGKGWEGSAYVDVRFAAEGYLRSINLAQSSGREVLDEIAVRIVRDLTFPDVPADLRGMEFTIRVPVVFRARRGP